MKTSIVIHPSISPISSRIRSAMVLHRLHLRHSFDSCSVVISHDKLSRMYIVDGGKCAAELCMLKIKFPETIIVSIDSPLSFYTKITANGSTYTVLDLSADEINTLISHMYRCV